MSSPERGKLLLAVRIRSSGWLFWGWIAISAWVAIVIVEIVATRRPGPLFLFGAMLPLLIRLLHPRLRFFENGVEMPIPPGERGKGAIRFLPWQQIERSDWDRDRLTLVGTQSILAGGPVEGGTVSISPKDRLRVEQILAAKWPAR
ncbi:MAG TPA: hypothetical protein VH639_10870 [Bryobacteraceae bacterium]|jgi:hypothetical protein